MLPNVPPAEARVSGIRQHHGLAACADFMSAAGTLFRSHCEAVRRCSLYAKPPTFFLRIGKAQEPGGVQTFRPEPSVERLDERVIRHDAVGAPFSGLR